MNNWDSVWNKIISDPHIKEEYRTAFLLNIFQKLCSKLNNDENFKKHVQNLYRQTFNQKDTTKLIIQKEFQIQLTDSDINYVKILVDAYFSKNGKRKQIPQTEKEKIYKKQNGICISCEQPLGNNWKTIHVDHIIPWVLVGDQLHNNYQLLCETCNKCKSSKTDYIFKSLINLN